MVYFNWDMHKDMINRMKHGVDFKTATEAFVDPKRKVLHDSKHGAGEKRYFCIGQIGNGRILTVRFTFRKNEIRIIGAGCWRKGRRSYYEKET